MSPNASHQAATTYLGTADEAVLFKKAATNAEANVSVTVAHRPKSKKDVDLWTTSRVTESQIAEKQPRAEATVFTTPTMFLDATSAGIQRAFMIHSEVATTATSDREEE